MATQKMNGAGTYAGLAGVDLTGKLHYLAKVGTDERIVLAGDGDPVIGQIYEENSLNRPVTVQTNGSGKCIAGAAIVAGARLQSDANGKAITLAAGVEFGTALNNASADEIFEFAFT